MFFPKALNFVWFDESIDTITVKQVILKALPHVCTQENSRGYSETLFRTAQNMRWQAAGKRLLEYPLLRRATNLVLSG